jgi:predicted phosphodiesterase
LKIAVISDIHGNLEALKAVVSHLEGKKVDKVVCLGDLVGYGPDPDEVVQLVKELGYDSVLGNHEVSLREKRERHRLNFMARENNVATENLLSSMSTNYCKKLARFIQLGDAFFVHGFPPDSVHKYSHKQSDETLLETFSSPLINYYFVGHTHELDMVSLKDEQLHRTRLTEGVYVLSVTGKYMINVGSVGQPRDGNNTAKYVVWDMEKRSLEVNYVPYDFERTIEKIKERGFPESFGLRLK